jgi:hypothetical protein
MRKHCIVIIFIVFFNIFAVCGAFGGNYEYEDVLPEPDYTEEIIVCVISIFVIIVAVGIVESKKNKLSESQTQEKSFSKSANFVSCVQFDISSPAAQRKKYVTPSFKAGIRF